MNERIEAALSFLANHPGLVLGVIGGLLCADSLKLRHIAMTEDRPDKAAVYMLQVIAVILFLIGVALT